MIRRTRKFLDSSFSTLRSFTHTHATHTARHQALLSACTSLLPPPAPCSSGPSSPLFYPVLTVTSVNGFTRFVNVVGLKLYCVLSLFCSITAELRSKLSLLCILLLLMFPQHPPSSSRSMSAFDVHEKKSICWGKKRQQRCWMPSCFSCFYSFSVLFPLLTPSHPSLHNMNGFRKRKKKPRAEASASTFFTSFNSHLFGENLLVFMIDWDALCTVAHD